MIKGIKNMENWKILDYPALIEVLPLSNYQLQLTFETGEVRIFDCKPYLGGRAFDALNDEKMFETAQVYWDTVGWANGADIAPETLYWDSIPIEKHETAKPGILPMKNQGKASQASEQTLLDYQPVTAVAALPGYLLKLTFASKEVRIFDFKSRLKRKMFYALNDEKLFETAKVYFDSVAWANGVDIAPETLYLGSIPIEETEQKNR